jgi:uncharacterized membrane protein YeiH
VRNNEPMATAAHSAQALAPRPLFRTADLAGTFVFAIEGAFAAIRGHLDLFGVMVLAFVTALGGGVIRDVLMGALPPSALRGWSYPGTAFAAGAIAFAIESHLQIPRALLLTLDAAGLSLFAVAGTDKALNAGIHPLSAVLLGTITGVGGGTLRDLLLGHVPEILRVDVYATAALFGAVILTLCRRLRLSPTLAAALGGIACFLLRMISLWQHWQLPGSTAPG